MKTIVGYHDTDRGLFLDLAEQIATLAVNRKTGDVLLDEGAGDDRINSAAILIRDLPRFVLTHSEAGARMQVEYGVLSRRKYDLGSVDNPEAARAWGHAANLALDKVRLAIELQRGAVESDSMSHASEVEADDLSHVQG